MTKNEKMQLLLSVFGDDKTEKQDEILRTESENDILVRIQEISEKIYRILLRESKNVFTLKEAAEYTQLSPSLLYKLTSQKSLKHYKPGKHIFFRKSDLDEFLTSNQIANKDN